MSEEEAPVFDPNAPPNVAFIALLLQPMASPFAHHVLRCSDMWHRENRTHITAAHGQLTLIETRDLLTFSGRPHFYDWAVLISNFMDNQPPETVFYTWHAAAMRHVMRMAELQRVHGNLAPIPGIARLGKFNGVVDQLFAGQGMTYDERRLMDPADLLLAVGEAPATNSAVAETAAPTANGWRCARMINAAGGAW